ncbi:hypothetical protein KSD_24600 [Ktedonobacter sp. SOSP1-85]|nr:hypothetical protein KSD_24600 [Ktedonobacter sp. SOSP1-85]
MDASALPFLSATERIDECVDGGEMVQMSHVPGGMGRYSCTCSDVLVIESMCEEKQQ